MPRRCNACFTITPLYDVNFCLNCGHKFHKVTFRSSSATYRRPRLLADDKTDRKESHCCKYQSLCAEYLKSLNWNEMLFEQRFDHCYCKNCYPESWEDFLVEAGSRYVIPRGCCRFGLQVDKVRADVEKIWRDWIVTYHGTSPAAAKSIIQNRQFLIPGDKSIDGEKIKIIPGHIKEKYHIYTSPTIAYSGIPCYCPPQKFQSNIIHKYYNARIVIQCRQKPGTFQVQPETIGAGSRRICPIISNRKVEIFTTVRASIVPYGLLINLEATT